MACYRFKKNDVVSIEHYIVLKEKSTTLKVGNGVDLKATLQIYAN